MFGRIGYSPKLHCHVGLGGISMVDQRRKRARPAQVVVDLKDLREPWDQWCKARGMTTSEAVRLVLGRVLKGAPVSEGLPNPADFEDEVGSERRRIELRVSATEYLALKTAANREGMSIPRWLAAYMQTHLTGDEHLGRAEVEALARSSQLVLALGRNINQIAYNLSQRADSDTLTSAQIAYVTDFLKEHTQAVAAVLHANSKRWRR